MVRSITVGIKVIHFIQVHVDLNDVNFSFRSGNEGAEYLFGMISIGFATLTSGFACIYNEKVLKNGEQPLLFVRCFQLSKLTKIDK